MMMEWGGGYPWAAGGLGPAMALVWLLPVAFVLYLAWRWLRAYERHTR